MSRELKIDILYPGLVANEIRFKMIGKMTSVLCVLIVGFTLLPTLGQSADETITPVPVAEQIYMLVGKGGNIGLFVGEDGTFLIDDQFAPLTEKIVEAIKSVGHLFLGIESS